MRPPPLRVLHVVAQMNRGGVETWLVQVLRHVDPARARLEFLVTRAAPGDYDAEIRALGSAVVRGGSPASPARFAARMLSVLRERGPYDVVHSHVHHFSGFVLGVARAAGVPVRVAHSHLDTRALDAAAGPVRRLYLRAMTAALRRFATRGLAVSEPAGAALFGPRWRDDARFGVARCGLDFGAYRAAGERAAVRRELGLPADALVLGHIGRFDPEKNHAFVLEIARAAFAREPRARLVLVGRGPLRAEAEARAARLGIADRVVFAGLRGDVPRVLAAMDAFVFPSVREGLPLVGLEAQAAGLPAVLSDAITREVVVVPELVAWRSLSEPPEAWAEVALDAARAGRRFADPVGALEASEFSLSRSVSGLLRAYGVASG